MAFTDVFGGELIFPSQLSYLSITTAVDVTLQWPTEQQITGDSVVADFIDVDATVGSLNIDMPSALVTGTGNKATINNIGSNTFTVRDSTGGTIQSVAPGEQWVIVLRDNTTAAGLWRTFQLGANVAVASASALAGAGIKAIGVLLNQQIDSDVEASTPFTVVDGDRAKALIYTAGAGTANLTAPGTLGNDWFFMLRNSGSGTLNILPASGLIDGAVSINLDPNDSCFIFTDGTNFFTIGLSAGSTIVFDFVSIPVPGSGDFVLSGANLDRIAYRFTGALTGNRRIVVPNTTQQYWVDNQTTGAFTLEIDTAAGVGQVIPQNESAIVYCDGTDVINAASSTSVTFPITIGQGGTAATTAAAALANLGGVPLTRILTAGAGLSGLGDLTADRTVDRDQEAVLGTKLTNQIIPNNTNTNIDFEGADKYDVGGWHNPGGANPDEFTVPTDVIRVAFSAVLFFTANGSNGPFDFVIEVNKNGSPEAQWAMQDQPSNTGSSGRITINLSTAFDVVASDVITLEVNQSNPSVASITADGTVAEIFTQLHLMAIGWS